MLNFVGFGEILLEMGNYGGFDDARVSIEEKGAVLIVGVLILLYFDFEFEFLGKWWFFYIYIIYLLKVDNFVILLNFLEIFVGILSILWKILVNCFELGIL